MENGSHYATKKEDGTPPEPHLFATFSEDRFLDAFLSPFGSLWAPFGLPLAPFGLPLAPFWLPCGSIWAPFGFLLAPFGSILVPFGCILILFGSISEHFRVILQFSLSFWFHFRLLRSDIVFFN